MRIPLILALLATFRLGTTEEDHRFKRPDNLEPVPNNLQYVFMVFRHGIRTPLYYLSKEDEINFPKQWPEGKGSLTESGKREMLHVGASLRTRYKGVAPEYIQDNVVVTSTPVERASVSADLVAKSLFSENPATSNIPNTVQTVTSFDKSMLFDDKFAKPQCPTYITLRDRVQTEEKSWPRELFYKVLNRELEHNLGDIRVNNMHDVGHVWDTIMMEKYNLKPERKWAEPFMSYMVRITQLTFWRCIHGATGMVKYFTGPMFYEMLNEMEDSRKERDRVRFHLHGSHDNTVSAVQWALGQQEYFLARPGDVIIIELYKDDTVKVLMYSCLREAPKKRMRYISLKPLCKMDPCPLSVFREKLSELAFPEDQWKAKCFEEATGTNRKNPGFGLFLSTKPFRLWIKSFFKHKKV